jgi:hypothetical protein
MLQANKNLLVESYQIGNEIIPANQIRRFDSQQPVSVANTSQPATQPASQTTKTRYLVSDWEANRNRISFGDFTDRSAVQSIASYAGVGGAVGSAVPVIGTTVGSAVGAVVGGVSRLFGGGSKPKRLSQHIEDFIKELTFQTFGNDSFSVGFGGFDYATALKNQYPKQDLEQFYINAIKQFLNQARQHPDVNSGDQASIDRALASLRFTDRISEKGSEITFLSYKPEPVYYTQQENGKVEQAGSGQVESISKENNKKIIGAIIGAFSLLSFLR